MTGVRKSAVMDRFIWRYELRRDWGDGANPLVAIGCNPSVADAEKDDATIRVLMGLALTEGFDGLHVYNLYAYRATDPDLLLRMATRHEPGDDWPYVIGERNQTYLEGAAGYNALGGTVLACWGAIAPVARQREVARLFPALKCLGVNKDGSPKHPLRWKLEGLWPWTPALLP